MQIRGDWIITQYNIKISYLFIFYSNENEWKTDPGKDNHTWKTSSSDNCPQVQCSQLFNLLCVRQLAMQTHLSFWRKQREGWCIQWS